MKEFGYWNQIWIQYSVWKMVCRLGG